MPLSHWLTRWFRQQPLGQRGEEFAARYLRRLGYHVVGRQVDLGVGELDIVAVDPRAARGRTVVFVEVKTRTSDVAGAPVEAVDTLRQQRMSQAALAYLKAHGLLTCPARFDVIALTWPASARQPMVEHFQNAFEPPGAGQFFS